MNDYSRGDVEFLAMEYFHRENGDNRSWENWDGAPSKLEYRQRAKAQLDEPIIDSPEEYILTNEDGAPSVVLIVPETKPKRIRKKSVE